MKIKKVTVIVLNYNSSDDCKKCIDFLEMQDYKALSIVVVDNASTNSNEKKHLQEICEGKDIQLVFNQENKGFSAGNNIGLRMALKDGAEWMLVINPDVELRDPHYISYVMEQIVKWSQAVVVGTNVLLPSGECQNPMDELTELEECLSIFDPFLRKFKFMNRKRVMQTGYCKKVFGCCFFIKASFLEKINCLDENVFMYCEEAILAKQVEKANYKEVFIKEVTAYHEHYDCQKVGNSSKRLQEYFKSRIYYIENYSDYSFLGKKLAILERKIESVLWKVLF